MSARARKRLDASSYLKEFGLRNATFVLEYNGRSTEWRVPVLGVSLMHGRARSVISGRATIASGARPWQLTFETDEFEGARTLTLKTSVRDLVPRSLAPAVPQLSLLQAFDVPVAGDATLQLSNEGDIRTATIALEIGKGHLRLPALPEAPMTVDGGVLKVAYDDAAQRVVLSPSTLRWRGSRITLSGSMQSEGRAGGAHPAWSYQLAASEGVFAADEFSVPPVPLELLAREGTHPAASRRDRARRLPPEGRRRGDRHAGRSRRRRRSRKHAARRHPQPDDARDLEGAVAQRHRARRARMGGRARVARRPAGRHLPLRERRQARSGRGERAVASSTGSRWRSRPPTSRCW